MDIVTILLTIGFLIVVIPLIIYLFIIDQRDKDAWYQNKIQRGGQEKKDEVWVKKSFRPRMLKLIKRNLKAIIVWSFIVLVVGSIIWFLVLQSLLKQL